MRLRNLLSKTKWIIRNFSKIKTHSIFIQAPYYLTHGDTINYNSDGLIVLNNCDCLEEANFKKAYNTSLKAGDWRNAGFDQRWRFYIVCYFAKKAIQLEGDFVECGVYRGGYTLAIMDYTNFGTTDKKFHLLDTFEGLDERYISDTEKSNGLSDIYRYEDSYEFVVDLFKDTSAVIIKGPVPETLQTCTAEKIAYLSIDMNCVEPEIAAANFFWDKIVSGGIIVLDDYGFSAHIEQKKAFDNFAHKKNISILSLPTGQAIIFKP